LIGLSKIGQLDLLRQLFGQVLVSKSVYHEVVIRGANRPGASEVAAAAWIEVCEIKDQLALRTLKLTLGIGESEAIILASEKSADFLILDDWKAR
jgi:predicted nucleic acid-binding protein